MGFQNYITEIEASSFTNVSIATLNRFAEAGYFQLEFDPDGLRLFSKSELAQVFGLSQPEPETPKPAPSVAVSAQPDALPAEAAAAVEPEVAPTSVQSAAPQPAAAQPVAAAEVREAAQTVAAPAAQPASAPGFNFLEQEVTRLKNLVGLHEKLIELREGEIRDLKQEREWLKLRIEKMENQGDRNQLLLLTEIQMATRMMRYQAERKSKIRGMLEWLGIVAPTDLPAPVQLGAPVDMERTQEKPTEQQPTPEFKRAA